MDKELLNLYFKKFNEFDEADDERKAELYPELKSLQKCIDSMWGIGG